MSHRNVDNTLAALEAAIRDDELAKAEAMQCGLDASLPLKPRTVVQLCDLGDRMLETGRRLQRARLDVDLSLPYCRAG